MAGYFTLWCTCIFLLVIYRSSGFIMAHESTLLYCSRRERESHTSPRPLQQKRTSQPSSQFLALIWWASGWVNRKSLWKTSSSWPARIAPALCLSTKLTLFVVPVVKTSPNQLAESRRSSSYRCRLALTLHWLFYCHCAISRVWGPITKMYLFWAQLISLGVWTLRFAAALRSASISHYRRLRPVPRCSVCISAPRHMNWRTPTSGSLPIWPMVTRGLILRSAFVRL